MSHRCYLNPLPTFVSCVSGASSFRRLFLYCGTVGVTKLRAKREGERLREPFSAKRKNMNRSLENVNTSLDMHEFVVSGDSAPELLSLLGAGDDCRVLGVKWNPTIDTYSVAVNINASKKYRGARIEPDLKYNEIPRLLTIVLTRRICQGIVYQCYDIYGLVSPITIQMKIQLRNLFGKTLNLGWDDPLPLEVKERWIVVLQAAKTAETVQFRRCIKPDEPVLGKPMLIVSNDASKEAMCTTAHVRWELEDGTFKCYLFSAKTRVAPLQMESIPRLEMLSAVLAARLSKAIQTHSNFEFSQVVHILDSMCTLATLHKDTVALGPFMGNRTSEILKTTALEPVSYTHLTLPTICSV